MASSLLLGIPRPSGKLLVSSLFLNVCLAAQSSLTLCDPMDSSPPGSSLHGILQARILEWAAFNNNFQVTWDEYLGPLSFLKARRSFSTNPVGGAHALVSAEGNQCRPCRSPGRQIGVAPFIPGEKKKKDSLAPCNFS